jgi:hypothetical protein
LVARWFPSASLHPFEGLAPLLLRSEEEDHTTDVLRLRASWLDLVEQTEGWLQYKP